MRISWLNLVVAVAVSIPLLWCFGAALAGGSVFAYRDVAHFYYPLEAWICDRWAHGEVPLWNPQEGNGAPVVAETTSAVFYPGKLVFSLPLTFERRFVLYVVLHIILAAWGAYCLTRYGNSGQRAATVDSRSTCKQASAGQPALCPFSGPAAGLSAVAYAFGGPVLFQYSNVAFLVGAAWLPWTLLAIQRQLHERSRVWVLAVGVCLALTVLGGDPQSAYHVGLLGLLYVVILRRVHHSGDDNPDRLAARPCRTSPDRSAPSHSTTGAVGRLVASAVLAGLLAAVQIVPAWSWVGNSDRGVYTYPRSVYEIPAYLRRGSTAGKADPAVASAERPGSWSGVAQGILGEPSALEHHGQEYSFSVAPWRLAEMLWPHVSGRTFPQNQRWLRAAGAEDRIWTPSLYLGILPLLLALGTWRLRNAPPRVQWFSWMLLLAVVGSFGSYGVGLFVQCVQQVFAAEPSPSALGGPVGGLYWLMVVVLPGYAHFRYPAKWMVIATLALAVLAGSGLDQMLTVHRQRFAKWLRIVGTVSLVAAVVVGMTRPWWTTWFADADPDELFGPLNTGGAWFDAWMACGHTALVCGAAWFLVSRKHLHKTRLGVLLLFLTACDIAWANGWLVLTAPTTSLEVATVLDRATVHSASSSFYRWPSRTWVPDTWRTTASRSRAAENLSWDFATLYAKLHLLGSHRSLLPLSTIASYDFREFLHAGSHDVPHPAILEALGAAEIILPDTYSPAASWRLEKELVTTVPGVAVWRNPGAFPEAWIVHDVRAWPQFASTDPQTIRRQMEELCFPNGQPRDLRRAAVVECVPGFALPALSMPVGNTVSESAHLTAAQGRRVDLDVTLSAPGLVVLNQLYDPHWVVDIPSEADDRGTIAVVRTNRIMQGVFLPAGRHTLVFHYVPSDLYAAGALSLASWLVTAVAFGRTRWKRRHRT
ncbi:MAG: hypothetical protein ACYC3X_10705 [Pirellulaceae bacterium]